MKCPSCGAEVAETAKTCPACGLDLPLMTRAGGETVHVAKQTGAVAGKVGRGLVEGAKGFGSGLKKGFNKAPDEGEKGAAESSEEKKDS